MFSSPYKSHVNHVIIYCFWVHTHVSEISTYGNNHYTNALHETNTVSHCGLAIYIKKSILRKKQELWKLKFNFTMQKYNLQKIFLWKKPKSFKILL
jgi:hypothetical protein